MYTLLYSKWITSKDLLYSTGNSTQCCVPAWMGAGFGERMCVCVCGNCLVVSNSLWPHGLKPTRLLYLWNSPGKNTGVGCHSLFQGIFLTQGSNPGLLHCRQIAYHLSHQGTPWGRMETYICMAESLCCPPETITILLINYIPTQNKKLN